MKRSTSRRGVSVLLVLALLSMTLALSYAMIRVNFTVETTQANYGRIGDSRQAAYAGLSAALRRMQQPSWAGVDQSLNGDLGGGLTYAVSFETGDLSLVPGTEAFQDFPYRVTVTSTGTAADPSNQMARSSHRVAAVVRLIPRMLNAPPASWNATEPYTLYQWSSDVGDTLRLDLPVQIRGPIYAQNELEIAPSYPVDTTARPFQGQIDEVAVFGTALSDAQVLGLYSGSSTIDSVATDANDRIAWWRLDEPASELLARDDGGQLDGIFDGGKPGGTAAPVGGGAYSASFDGFNDQIHLGTIDVSGDAITISAWIRPTAFPVAYGRIIAKATGISESSQYWTLSHYPTAGRRAMRFQVKTDDGGTKSLLADQTNLVAGQWTHIVATYDGSKMRVYQDGQLKNETDKTGWIVTNPDVVVSLGNTPSAHPRAKYLRDLTSRQQLTGVDHRPLTGTISAPVASTSAGERSLVTDELQLVWSNVEITGNEPVGHPGEVSNYRLYPGGRSYPVPSIGSNLRNQTLAPDPENNPLGVFYRRGALEIRENVTITGTLIVDGTNSQPDIEIRGTNVNLQSTVLPAVDGSPAGVQLPVAIVRDDLRVNDEASGTLSGLAIAWDEAGFRTGSQNTNFTISGRLLASRFVAESRTEWMSRGPSWHWSSRLTDFFLQLPQPDAILFFPQWLSARDDLDSAPKLVVQPAPSPTTFHWHDWTKPVFVAHPDDGGLRWELLDLRDLP